MGNQRHFSDSTVFTVTFVFVLGTIVRMLYGPIFLPIMICLLVLVLLSVEYYKNTR